MCYSHNCLVLIYFNDLAYKVKDELLLWSNFCTKKYFMLAILLPLSDPLIVLTFPNSLSRKKAAQFESNNSLCSSHLLSVRQRG